MYQCSATFDRQIDLLHRDRHALAKFYKNLILIVILLTRTRQLITVIAH